MILSLYGKIGVWKTHIWHYSCSDVAIKIKRHKELPVISDDFVNHLKLQLFTKYLRQTLVFM